MDKKDFYVLFHHILKKKKVLGLLQTSYRNSFNSGSLAQTEILCKY